MSTALNCYSWMLNQEEKDPCTIAQEVGQLCNPECEWNFSCSNTVSVTNFQESNYVPSATTNNSCTCSWSSYNLLSACSYCVGQTQNTSWNTWITNCGNYASNDSYLPAGVSLSQGVPFWAITNPSTWGNAVFSITEASNIAEQDSSDVTSGPSSTPTASSSSSVPIGPIVGGVIGGIAIIIIGGLLIFWVVRRRRHRRTHTGPIGVPASHPVVPSTWSRTPVQATPFGYARASSAPLSPYLVSPVHSTTSLAPTSLVSPISVGFSSTGHNVAPPITDVADMITPFLATSPRRQTNRSNTSPPTGKAAEALAERVMAPPGQRMRMNPPSYLASTEPGSAGAATTWTRRLSMKKHKKRKESESGMTTYSGHSRTSTKESVTTSAHTGSRAEQSRPGAGTVQSVESAVGAGGVQSVDGGDSVETTHGRREGVSDHRPPEV